MTKCYPHLTHGAVSYQDHVHYNNKQQQITIITIRDRQKVVREHGKGGGGHGVMNSQRGSLSFMQTTKQTHAHSHTQADRHTHTHHTTHSPQSHSEKIN